MRRFSAWRMSWVLAAALWIAAIGSINLTQAGDQSTKQLLRGRLIAIGIPGISAISAVGTFLPGGPIHDTPAFAAYTQPGRVLDPARILVGSTSNFGEAIANVGQLPGSFLSIDPSSPVPLLIPPLFAAGGGQAS